MNIFKNQPEKSNVQTYPSLLLLDVMLLEDKAFEILFTAVALVVEPCLAVLGTQSIPGPCVSWAEGR